MRIFSKVLINTESCHFVVFASKVKFNAYNQSITGLLIPAGQAVEFYDKLCANESEGSASDSIKSFQLGFIDVADKDYKAFLFNERLSHEPVVY